jgi:two-component system, LytTR family, sensor kinase
VVRHIRPSQIWIASLVAWSFIALLAAVSVIQLYRAEGNHLDFSKAVSMQLSQMLPFVPLTPFVFAFVAWYPIRRGNWIRGSLLYLLGGAIFTAAHVVMRGVTPYGIWDAKARAWHSAVWDHQAHRFNIQWHIFKNMFLSNAFDDITSTYIPIVLLAYVVSYYLTLKDRESLTARLEAQLVKSNLQALKSQLQPHFLFNTMHSISGLMFTDVRAADKMMARLSELLRMSLEDGTEQVTTLNKELDFVNGYLEIEKIRFGERLTVMVEIAGDTLDAQVPHLLLQPFVENAVQHGIAKLSSNGRIQIVSRREGDQLCLTVKDNGPGFGVLRDASPQCGLGIGTSQERLRTLYGDHQALEFATPPEGGAEVTIRIPFRPICDGE